MVSKTFLANGVSTFFIYGKLTFINGPRKVLANRPSWILIFSVVPLNEIPPFSIDLITFTISHCLLALFLKP